MERAIFSDILSEKKKKNPFIRTESNSSVGLGERLNTDEAAFLEGK